MPNLKSLVDSVTVAAAAVGRIEVDVMNLRYYMGSYCCTPASVEWNEWDSDFFRLSWELVDQFLHDFTRARV
jgi:hypothetical protein